MKLRHVIILLWATAAVAVAVAAADDIAIVGITQVTHNSTGFGYGTLQTQSSPVSPGFSVEYRHWWSREGAWSDRGLVVTYSVTSSGARFVALTPPYGVVKFGLNRHEIDVGYVHRFHMNSALSPYLKGSAGGFITNGGMAPGGVLGTDGQFDAVVEAGSDTRISRHLGIRYGVALHWFRAPNFSDKGYSASRTWILEPMVGMSWQF